MHLSVEKGRVMASNQLTWGNSDISIRNGGMLDCNLRNRSRVASPIRLHVKVNGGAAPN